MKRKAAVVMSAAMAFNAVGSVVSMADTAVKSESKSVYPNSQMVVKPKEFMKNEANWDGPDVVEDDNLRFMINSRYERKGTDEELKKLPVTKEMIQNLRVLSPEQ